MSATNALKIWVYSTGTTLLNDPDFETAFIENLSFKKQYPGGLYGGASFYAPRHILRRWLLKGAYRVRITLGHETVYEGYISGFQYLQDENTEGVIVQLVGATEQILMSYTLNKRWCDGRISEDIWPWGTTLSAADKCTFDRNNQLKFVPKNVEWATDNTAAVFFTMPTGETVKRVTFDYAFAEGAQSWRMGLQESTSTGGGTGTPYWEITADGSGSQDVTLGTPKQRVRFFFHNNSGGAQTPAADGSIYGRVSNVRVYSETGSINMEEIVKDVQGYLSSYINSSTYYIQAAGSALSLVPYIADDSPSAAGIIDEAVGMGDGNNARWAWGFYDSEKAPTRDGKPVLYLEPYVLTTDYDYQISLYTSPNRASAIEMIQDISIIRNWIELKYEDDTGAVISVSPNDDSTLKDSTSITNYGQRAIPGGLYLGHFSSTVATNFGKRYLATYKDPQWRIVRPITVRAWVEDKNGIKIPAAKIEPGKRIRIIDWDDLDDSGNPPTFVITQTEYDYDSDSVTLTIGVPSMMFLPQLQRAPGEPPPHEIIQEPEVADLADLGDADVTYKEVSGGGDKKKHDNWRRWKYVKAYAKKSGVDLWKVKGNSAEKRAIIKAAKKHRKKRG